MSWRLALVLGTAPALIGLALRTQRPESPRWLLGHGRCDQARGRFHVTGWQRDELVEARTDFILADVRTAKAYAEHFDAQMHRGKVRKLLSALRVFRRLGVILLEMILAR